MKNLNQKTLKKKTNIGDGTGPVGEESEAEEGEDSVSEGGNFRLSRSKSLDVESGTPVGFSFVIASIVGVLHFLFSI